MRRSLLASVLLLPLLLATVPLAAQQPSIRAGDLVRVEVASAGGERLEGRVWRAGPSELLLAVEGGDTVRVADLWVPAALPAEEVSVEVGRGTGGGLAVGLRLRLR